MRWQDIVLSLSGLVFSIALIPTILSKEKPALTTDLLTCLFVALNALAFLTLSLWFAAATSTLNFIVWFVIFTQKYRQDHKHHIPDLDTK